MTDEDLTRLWASGIFAAIDVHFARLMARLHGELLPELALGAALTSRATREGHICLDLREVAGKPLANDPGGLLCPKIAVWCDKLRGSKVVGRPGDHKPLILDHEPQLYLYRYWQYQQKLADAVKVRLAGPFFGGSDPTPSSTGLPPSESKASILSSLDGTSSTLSSLDGTDSILPSLDGRGWGRVAWDDALKARLERLFPSATTDEVDWQKVAAFAAATSRFCVISGGPGTGKTTTVATILALLIEETPSLGLRIALAAPTGKAAARLQEAIKNAKARLPCPEAVRQAIPETASTIHRLLGSIQGSPYFRHHEANPLPVDVVVIDEASMVDLALMSKLFQALPVRARVILLGDKDQLASVEAGAVLGDICETGKKSFFSRGFGRAVEEICHCRLDPALLAADPAHPPKDCLIQLQKSYRFADAGGIGLLSRKVRESDAAGAMSTLRSGEYAAVSWHEVSSGPLLAEAVRDELLDGFRGYFEAVEKLKSHPGGDAAIRIGEVFERFGQFRILCAVREGFCGVAALNGLVEQLFEAQRLVPKETRWYVGRPVLIGRNDYNLHLFNGDVGIFLPDPQAESAPRVFFPGPEGGFRAFHPLRLPEHETVFAATVHKSQGSEFNHVLFVLPDRDSPVLTRELVYTAITRARDTVSLWGLENLFLKAIGRSTRRMSGLSRLLWGTSG